MKFLLWLSVPLVALDQLTKLLIQKNIPYGDEVPIIPGFFSLVHVSNTGAAFSLLQGNNLFFIILATVVPTLSPSMDIQVSSNFERLVFEAYDRDPPPVRGAMASLAQSRRFKLTESALGAIRALSRAMSACGARDTYTSVVSRALR